MDGNEAGWSAKALQFLWAPFLGLIALVWNQQQSSFKSEVDSAKGAAKAAGEAAAQALTRHTIEDEKAFNAVHEELQTQRGHIAKIFDQMREESKLSVQRHIELLGAIHSKADK